MGLKKQDMNGVRTPLDVERRHKLGAIPGLEKDVSDLQEEVIVDSQLSSSSTHAVQNKVITQNFTSLSNNKVDKVSGKGLSSNDFTDSEKEILDMITLQKIQQWDNNSFSIDMVYPIGSIYMSVNSTDPSTLFSGTTWQQIKDTFLLSAGDTYTNGSTGGTEKHQHEYGLQYAGAWQDTVIENGQYTGILNYDSNNNITLKNGYDNMAGSYNINVNNSCEQVTPKSATPMHYRALGNTENVSNMPPYLVVYMWKRTA